MPLYDYTCDECGQTFELLVGSATVAVCPHCGSNRLQQLIGAPIAPGKSAAIMAARARRQRGPRHELQALARQDRGLTGGTVQRPMPSLRIQSATLYSDCNSSS